MRYAQFLDGDASPFNFCEIDEGSDWTPPEGQFVVQTDVAQLDWVYADGSWTGPGPKPPEVPDRVTSRQFFLQLDASGLLNAVEGWIDQQPLPIQIAFERSSTFVRDDAMLQQGFSGLGFSPQQIDAFFTAAASL